MTIEVDGTDHTGLIPPGDYHVRIVKWDDTFEQFDKVICEFEILAGGQQVGRRHTEWFVVSSEKAKTRIATLLEATGAMDSEDRSKSFEPEDIVGGECIVGIEHEEYQGKTYARADFRFTAVDDANVPPADGGGAGDDKAWDI